MVDVVVVEYRIQFTTSTNGFTISQHVLKTAVGHFPQSKLGIILVVSGGQLGVIWGLLCAVAACTSLQTKSPSCCRCRRRAPLGVLASHIGCQGARRGCNGRGRENRLKSLVGDFYGAGAHSNGPTRDGHFNGPITETGKLNGPISVHIRSTRVFLMWTFEVLFTG